jgi:hypothetical protein
MDDLEDDEILRTLDSVKEEFLIEGIFRGNIFRTKATKITRSRKAWVVKLEDNITIDKLPSGRGKSK